MIELMKYPLSVDIPLGIQGISINYWARPPEVEEVNKIYKMKYPYTALYLKKEPTYEERGFITKDMWKTLSFTITKNNIAGVKEFFKEISVWFQEENKKELYGFSDDGKMIFNSEYNKLKAKFVNEFSGVKTALVAAPMVLEVGVNNHEPGVALYINMQANMVLLPEKYILKLCKFFEEFDFTSYDLFMQNCIIYASQIGAINQSQIQGMYDHMKRYDTNLK